MMFTRQLLLLICMVSRIYSTSLDMSDYQLYRYEGTGFHRFTRDNNTGNIYIGAENSLILLSDDFNYVSKVSTCANGDDCNNINKVLVIDYNNNSLISCGGGNHGGCEARSLSTLEMYDGTAVENIVGMGNLSAVGFISLINKKEKIINEPTLWIASIDSESAKSRMLATRRLDPSNPFAFIDDIKIQAAYNERDSIQYVTGFYHKEFNYFVSNRENQARISRICETGELSAFSEIFLRCVDSNFDYEIVQAMKVELIGSTLASALNLTVPQKVFFGVFTTEDLSNSALCMFTLNEIEEAFFKAINGCYTSGSPYVLGYVDGAECSENNVREELLKIYMCEGSNLRVKYSQGTLAESAYSQPVLQYANYMTSISVAVEENNTIAFLGTYHGKLIKVHIHNGSAAREYETLALDEGFPVRALSLLDATSTNLTILTENKLLKIRVESCTHYTSCSECVGLNDGGGDPYCGWCTLENRCSRLSECFTDAWIVSGSNKCISISGTAPEFLPITKWVNEKISLDITQLPSNQIYTCKLGGTAVKTHRLTGGQINLACDSFTQAPILQEGEVANYSLISVYSNLTGVDIVSTRFTFYNCSAIKSCYECVTSFDCDWCPLGHKCTHTESTPCGEKDITVKDDADCPRLVPQSKYPLLHSGKSKEIVIEASHLPIVTNYICVVDDDEANPIQATRNSNSSITCNSSMYKYSDEVQEKNITLKVAWNNSNYIDYQFIVTLYKCSVGQPDCSTCLSSLSTPPVYNCSWCNRGGCVYASDCVEADIPSSCPAPVVNEIVPNVLATSSDVEDVDHIQLNGTDLGKYVNEVEIDVGGKPCKIINESFVVGRSVSCCAPAFANEGQQWVNVTVAGQSTVVFDIPLNYQRPILSSISPAEGIMAGGTDVIIKGEKLNFETINVYINTSICGVESKNSTHIVCKTGAHETNACYEVTVTFGFVEKHVPDRFCYRANPKIFDYNPKKSINAGGRVITVYGSDFQYVQDARMRVTKGSDQFFYCNCKNKTASSMICDSPIISDSSSRRKRQATKGDELSVTFILDGLELNSAGLTYFPNPVYFNFTDKSVYNSFVDDDGFYLLKDSDTYFFLYGLDITLASDVEDVSVFIGETELTVIEIAMTHVKVQLSSEKYDATLVSAKHNNIHKVFGDIKYPGIDYIVMLIIICTLLVFIIIISIIAIRYKYRTSQIKNEVKNILLEMDELEKTVKDEARQAIADLTLGLTDLTEDLKGVGMPFLSHRDYACSMLFTGFEVIPDSVEIDERDEDQRENTALLKFSKLLMDRQFLLAFIRMINNNDQITIREKGNFASLLTVAMIVENKLEYLTDILEILLKEYIEDHMYSKKAKQVLIRNETVTEKLLSNWIALSMYNYLKFHAAFPLYLLYQAIKCRIQMGPVDAVTNFSTHSLSIDHILPSGIEGEEISLVVLLNDEDGEQIEVTVLTCDSISQVKTKLLDGMYKNRPFSARPKIDELDLEWRNGRNGHLVLNDRDNNSLRSGNWQKINTLTDFGVQNRSVVALIARKSVVNVDVQGDVVSPTSPYFSKGQGYQNVVLTEIQFDFQPEEGISYYHLVKDDDSAAPRDLRSEVRKEFKRGQTIQYKRKKMIKEVHFPRLVSTKETIQRYVDDMFKAIVKTPNNTHKVPLAIKYLFDLFDKEGGKHEVDSSILKTWKNHSFLARFWVPVITHPNFIFDIAQMRPVEVALDIISRTFLDSCSAVKIKFTKESPVNRLLYTKEIESYRKLVDSFYSSVSNMPDCNRKELVEELDIACQNFSGLFSKSSTLYHLYSYAEEHKAKLLKVLRDEVEVENNMADTLKEISDVLKTPKDKNGQMH
ncbi:plexin-B-like [Anneissia japonica]|uniref:plexin-B-like n=1 Tax=Anneissia japonica TaxID=1529436 RepID=UPI0014255DA6|nr:plexin-B-like [Anneissia japonica]